MLRGHGSRLVNRKRRRESESSLAHACCTPHTTRRPSTRSMQTAARGLQSAHIELCRRRARRGEMVSGAMTNLDKKGTGAPPSRVT
eukprot:3849634-Prymnesium_polylepis.1